MTDSVAAHEQTLTLHVVAHIPDHAPREDDPYYHLFEEVKRRLKKQGLWKCIINDDYCGGQPELHHSHIEFSQQNAMDFHKVNTALGLHLESEDDFAKWINSPGNLEVLCVNHHRTHFGIHVLPGPLWEPLRYRKAGVAAGGEFLTAEQFNKKD